MYLLELTEEETALLVSLVLLQKMPDSPNREMHLVAVALTSVEAEEGLAAKLGKVMHEVVAAVRERDRLKLVPVMLLRDKLWPGGEKDWKPLVVACANCQMTMWATSENAHLDKAGEYIYCSGCLSVS